MPKTQLKMPAGFIDYNVFEREISKIWTDKDKCILHTVVTCFDLLAVKEFKTSIFKLEIGIFLNLLLSRIIN